MKQHGMQAPELELVDEAKVSTLLGMPTHRRFEASGVCVKDGACYVVFDNTPYLARFELTSSRLCSHSELHPLHRPFSGYEDIAYDPRAERFFMVSAKRTTGLFSRF